MEPRKWNAKSRRWTRQSITTTPTYIRHKRRFPHTGLDPLPIQALEEAVQLHLPRPVSGALAAKPVLRALLQQLLAQILGILAELGRVPLLILLDAPVDLLALDLLFAGAERRLALDHLVEQAAEAEPIGREGVPLVVDHLRRHVTHRAHPTAHQVALRDLHREAEIGYSHVTVIVQKYVFRLAVSVDDTLKMKVLQTAHDLGRVESGAIYVETRFAAHVVNMKLEITAVHNGQHETERVLRLVRVRERDDELGVDFLQNVLLDQHHRLALSLLYSLLLQLLARVHLTGGAHLARADLAEAAFAQYPVHPEGLVCHRLRLQPFPLEIPREMRGKKASLDCRRNIEHISSGKFVLKKKGGGFFSFIVIFYL